MKFQGVEVCKRDMEVIRFLQTGSNNYWDSYYSYTGRKKKIDRPTLTIATWFNHTIRGLHKKGMFLNIPFVYRQIKWMNPGVNASRANFQAITLQDAVLEQRKELRKII
jgi:hypothetical protein